MPIERTADHPARVVAVATLTPQLRRVELESPSLPTATLLQDVALVLPDPLEKGRTLRRRYTVRDVSVGRLALETVVHGHGPGSDWAGSVAPGDTVVLYGPRAGATVVEAARYLLLADEAGLPAVLELQRALTGRTVTAVVEVASGDEELAGAEHIRWLRRDGQAPGEPDALLAAADDFGPTAADAAYVLAESRVTAAVRDRLLAAGMARSRLHAKGYWNRDDPRRAGSPA